jgi:hypothetical protein
MKENGGLKKKILPCILVVCIALLIEIFVFNIRSYESLFYEEKMLGEFESFVENDEQAGISSLYINTGGEKIHNIYLNMGYMDAVSGKLEGGSVSIAVKEAGASSFFTVADTMISPDHTASQYVFFNTKGSEEQIRIVFPLREKKSIRLYEVMLNAHRPLFFSWLRFILLIIAGGLCFIAGKAFAVKKEKAQKADEPSN